MVSDRAQRRSAPAWAMAAWGSRGGCRAWKLCWWEMRRFCVCDCCEGSLGPMGAVDFRVLFIRSFHRPRSRPPRRAIRNLIMLATSKNAMLLQAMLLGGTSALQVGPSAAPRVVAQSRSLSRCSAVHAQAVDDKAEVEEYFNNEGFNRWSRIYSEDGEVNKVQLDIRTGHGITVDKVLGWVDADGSAAAGETFADAGCGVGSLALPLADRGTGRCHSRSGLTTLP